MKQNYKIKFKYLWIHFVQIFPAVSISFKNYFYLSLESLIRLVALRARRILLGDFWHYGRIITPPSMMSEFHRATESRGSPTTCNIWMSGSYYLYIIIILVHDLIPHTIGIESNWSIYIASMASNSNESDWLCNASEFGAAFGFVACWKPT
jgi:hypothetical protein